MTPRPKNKRADQWLQRLLDSNHALVILFFFSALEATIIPVPLELVLIPYMLAERHKIWRIASVALAGCLFGASMGYWVGFGLYESVGQWFLSYTGGQAQFNEFLANMEGNGFWAIFMVGLTPVPFQIAQLAAGASQYSYWLFLVASLLSRSLRYYGLALLVMLIGEQAMTLWRKHSVSVGIGLLVILVIGLGIQYF
ncbi:Undecaprenyl-diphosphate phosphatase [Saliniradius amylolyticus]|uniref:Undecaprenyl-diphosphate phosphatase n=1 Tax=Saliniradius amylolyticus TaxID=2183582 RepID=A0A2S2E2U7_9ALTE|nr:VTT domain-containing protein [Saliniradius amylolyticus]AWL11580.1 Undecaprenyl-diphosphate phosphatase [Saliniradius amylolyticus]